MKPDKINLNVLIENDQKFEDSFISKQKLQVIVNKAVENLNIDANDRELKREDKTPLKDLSQTIEEVGLNPDEVLFFFKIAKKPIRDKGFAR